MSVWPNIDCQRAREAANSQTRVALPICSLKSWRNHGGFLKSLDFSSCWKVNKAEFCYEQLMQQQYRCTEQPKAMAGRWKLFYHFRRESQPTPKQLILPGNTFRDPPRGISLSWSQIQSSQQPRLTLLPACKVAVSLRLFRLGWSSLPLPSYHGSFLQSFLSSHLNTTSALRTCPTPSLKLHSLLIIFIPVGLMLSSCWRVGIEAKNSLIHIFMYMCLLECMYVYYMCIGALRGQKKASDALKLELQVVMSYCMGAGNLSWVLWRSSKYS